MSDLPDSASILNMGDFARLQEVIKELNAGDPFPAVKVWPDMTDDEFFMACLEADNIIDKALEKYRNDFKNPSFFGNLIWICTTKYREKLKRWRTENGCGNAQGGSGSIRDGEAS